MTQFADLYDMKLDQEQGKELVHGIYEAVEKIKPDEVEENQFTFNRPRLRRVDQPQLLQPPK